MRYKDDIDATSIEAAYASSHTEFAGYVEAPYTIDDGIHI
jgi:hypothetical protein